MSNYPPTKTQFNSRFGGFWSDLRNGHEILQGKLELGWITPQEAEWLRFWIDNGFVILPGAVEHSMVDAVKQDIDKVLESEHELSRVSYWKNGEKHFTRASKELMKETEAKLLDMHMLSETVRKAIFSSTILRFITLVFERRPTAFQSLTFEYGSQQPVHCDVAFVRVSSPREFAASWIALEDIQEGSGELEYYPGSHRLKDRLFDGETPWASGNMEGYSDDLARDSNRANLQLQRFLPRKGDVLIWNAGLYHGGSPRTDAVSSRNSIVTHYCPADRYPMYADGTFSNVIETPYGGTVCGSFPSSLHSV